MRLPAGPRATLSRSSLLHPCPVWPCPQPASPVCAVPRVTTYPCASLVTLTTPCPPLPGPLVAVPQPCHHPWAHVLPSLPGPAELDLQRALSLQAPPVKEGPLFIHRTKGKGPLMSSFKKLHFSLTTEALSFAKTPNSKVGKEGRKQAGGVARVYNTLEAPVPPSEPVQRSTGIGEESSAGPAFWC